MGSIGVSAGGDQWESVTATSEGPRSDQTKQIRYLSLIRILCWPFRSPVNDSSRLLGGITRSERAWAPSSATRRRSATDSMLANCFTRSRLNSFSVFLHWKLRITIHRNGVLRYTSNVQSCLRRRLEPGLQHAPRSPERRTRGVALVGTVEDFPFAQLAAAPQADAASRHASQRKRDALQLVPPGRREERRCPPAARMRRKGSALPGRGQAGPPGHLLSEFPSSGTAIRSWHGIDRFRSGTAAGQARRLRAANTMITIPAATTTSESAGGIASTFCRATL